MYFGRVAETSARTSAAEAAVFYLREVSPEMRGCAILDRSGEVLAATGTIRERWNDVAEEFIAASDRAAGEEATHSHVATADGEVFCVRHGDLIAVAVTERFVLSSLMVFDMRAALRRAAERA